MTEILIGLGGRPIFDCPCEHSLFMKVVMRSSAAKIQACHHYSLKIVTTLYPTSE